MRNHCQDYTHLKPKLEEIKNKGTVSSDTAILLVGMGCSLVFYGILIYDILTS